MRKEVLLGLAMGALVWVAGCGGSSSGSNLNGTEIVGLWAIDDLQNPIDSGTHGCPATVGAFSCQFNERWLFSADGTFRQYTDASGTIDEGTYEVNGTSLVVSGLAGARTFTVLTARPGLELRIQELNGSGSVIWEFGNGG